MSTSLDLEKAQSLSAGSQGGPDDKEVSPSEAVPSDATSPEHLTRALSARQVSMIAIGESPFILGRERGTGRRARRTQLTTFTPFLRSAGGTIGTVRSLLPIPDDRKSEADVERATGTLPRHRQKPRQRRTCLAPDQLQHRRCARLLGHALPRVRQALFSARANLRRLIRSAHSVVARSEMATEFPLAGSFTTYAARFGDPALGFTIGWNYAFNDAVSTAGDLTAAQVRPRLLIPLPLPRQRGCAHAPPLSPGPHRLLDAQVQLAAFPLLALLRRRRQPHPRSSLWRGAPVSLPRPAVA